jgi:putative redox protein
MTIRVVRDQLAPMRHEIHIGRNILASDLSAEEGGDGSAPNPHDLYDAALGACTALTVLWYAKHKKIPVEGIEVSVERDASQERAGIYRLSAALTLTGDLSAAQREELLRAAQKCPVHKLMTEVTTEISTTLSGQDR